jgi:hypothetical protein
LEREQRRVFDTYGNLVGDRRQQAQFLRVRLVFARIIRIECPKDLAAR